MDYYTDTFLTACEQGIIDDAKKAIQQGSVDVNVAKNKEGLNGLMLAAINGKYEIAKFLIVNQNIEINAEDEKGNTALHFACEKGDKEIALLLIIKGINYGKKNNSNVKAGDGNLEIKQFLTNIVEEEKALNELKQMNQDQLKKLNEIFNEMDNDNTKKIDQNKAARFNKFVDETGQLTSASAQKDAKDFIKYSAICNKETVNADEWLFAFSKLIVCEPDTYDKFIKDYEEAIIKKGKLKNYEIDISSNPNPI